MADHILAGIPVSAGIAIGKALFVNRSHSAALPRQTVISEQVGIETSRLENAFLMAEQELEEVRTKVPAELAQHKLILESHLMMLRDPNLKGAAIKYVKELRLNAEWALEKATSDVAAAFEALSDAYLRARVQDVRQVSDRVQGYLLGREMDLRAIGWRAIIMAHDLTPADTVELEVSKIMAFATTRGGKTSHTGILARTMGIPALVGVMDLEEKVNDNDFVVIDGFKGRIVVNPSESELLEYNKLATQFAAYQKNVHRRTHLPAETEDGFRVQVLANIELAEEVAQVIDNGAEGVGLFRTEYAYLNRTDLPTEEELFERYSELASIMSPRKVVFRTLDLGADKIISRFGSLEEANPAMGLRAIRFCLQHPEMFKCQLRAILRASHYGNVSIMFPMISGLNELRAAQAHLSEAMDELLSEDVPFKRDIPVGIMIELPGAVMIAEILAKEVDFFSIGTNDLIQYSLGIDRTNQNVSYLYQPLHPAVLRSIKWVVDAAHEAGIEVSLCGEVASDPFCIPILMGMQIDCISLSPQAIPGIKRIIRQTSMEECRRLLKMTIEQRTVGRINRLVKNMIF
ncbi:MAG: phosphoenolpyruvate--protein phosphotransferase, partial [Proteobacteria bacterium]|nr:phosphoenolpyruvate--protein phosphotransferase [Pseudomonadota bacterium]